jgi:hypothetical protein
MEAQAPPMAHSCCPALGFAGTPLQRSRLTGGEPMTTPPREDDDPRVEDRSRGPGPATRAHVVLDPRKMSTREMAAAIMAMVAASKKKKG